MAGEAGRLGSPCFSCPDAGLLRLTARTCSQVSPSLGALAARCAPRPGAGGRYLSVSGVGGGAAGHVSRRKGGAGPKELGEDDRRTRR